MRGTMLSWILPLTLLPATLMGQSYPVDAVVDVTKAPYNADPTGATDARAAIQAAMDAHDGEWVTRTIVYFPAGTYRLSDRIVLDTHDTGSAAASGRGIILAGAGKDLVTLKLADEAAGFGNAGSPRAVVDFNEANDQSGYQNVAFQTHIRGLTIDVGTGNPGAIGLDFCASNSGAIRDLRVRSSDPAKAGKTGILLSTLPGPQLLKNVEVDGFDWGLETESDPQYITTVEFLTLRNCRLGGIRNRQHSIAIRGLTTDSLGGPAVWNEYADGFLVLIDSALESGPASDPAIDNNGFAYLRHIRSTGYAQAFEDASAGAIDGANLSEWFTGPGEGLFDTAPYTSLHLPIEETPDLPAEPVTDWVSVDAFGAVPGDSANDADDVQQAIDSMAPGESNEGRHTLYFPGPGKYTFSHGVVVPPHVHRIIGCFAGIHPISLAINTDPVFTISGDGGQLVIEAIASLPTQDGPLRAAPFIRNSSNRDLVLRDLTCFAGRVYDNSGSGKLFLENVSGLSSRYWSGKPIPLAAAVPQFDFGGQDVWARQLNTEQKDLKILNNGGDLWILGIKNEEDGTLIRTTNGGRTELLGGTIMPLDVDDLTSPAFDVIDASASFVTAGHVQPGNTSREFYQTLVREERSGSIQTLAAATSLHHRSYSNGAGVFPSIIPLFSASSLSRDSHWRLNHFGITANSGSAADVADPDRDNSSNKLERAFKTNPNDPASVHRPEHGIVTIGSAPHLTFTYHRLSGGSGSTATWTSSGLTYSLQSSPSLLPNSWTANDAGFTLLEGPTDQGNGTESLTIRTADPVDGTTPAFLRLAVD